MDLWQLHIFRKVIDHRSFSKAAEAVNLSQPTVSSHIKYLEDHFGCRLLDRLGKEVLPTKAGELLYGYATRLLVFRDEMETALAGFQGVIKGRLNIGGSTIPGGYILPRLIGPFVREHREVTVSIRISDTQTILGEVAAGELEMGIVGAEVDDKRIRQDRLIEDEMKLVVPANHPWAKRNQVSPALLSREPFIVREKGSGTLKSIQACMAAGGHRMEELHVVAEMGSTTAVCQGIKNGIGVSILSPIAVEEELRLGTLKALDVEGWNLRRNFYLTRHRQRTASPLCQLFIRFIEKASAGLLLSPTAPQPE
ncbi:MAG: selenium metabolism-associated LysR family transcriptional regulator [Thermodesulfobacteriota bacterium]